MNFSKDKENSSSPLGVEPKYIGLLVDAKYVYLELSNYFKKELQIGELQHG
jgi:hypothetical protein